MSGTPARPWQPGAASQGTSSQYPSAPGAPPSHFTPSSFPSAPAQGHGAQGHSQPNAPRIAPALNPRPAMQHPQQSQHPLHGQPAPGGQGIPPGLWPATVQAPRGVPGTPHTGAAAVPISDRPGAKPAALSGAPTLECAWKEHTAPDGRKYYYNSSTKTSVWSKPKELADAEVEFEAKMVLYTCPWKEHRSPDGRPYFHNKALGKSVWKIPEELAAAQKRAAALRSSGGSAAAAAAASAAASAAAAAAVAAAAPTEARPAGGEFMYATKEEAKSAFKALLSAQRVGVDWKWERVVKHLEAATDSRFSALKSNGERQSCFKEWGGEQRAEAARALQARVAAKRQAFVAMLEERATVFAPGARFSKCEAVCFEDERFAAVGEKERKEVFEEWIEQRRVRLEAEERAALEAKRLAFRALLEARQDDLETAILPSDTWSELEQTLSSEPVFVECPPVQRLHIWGDFLQELVKQERDAWAVEDAARFRKERKSRDLFKELLAKHRKSHVIKARTSWTRYREVIRKEPEYLACEENTSGSRPKELFRDEMHEMEDRYARDKARLKALLAECKFEFSTASEWSDFLAALEACDSERVKDVLEVNKRLFFEEMYDREQARSVREHSRRRELKVDMSRQMKRASEFVSHDMPWDEARQILLDKGFTIIKKMQAHDAERVWEDWVDRQRTRLHKRAKKDKREREHKDKRKGGADGGADRGREMKRSRRTRSVSPRDANAHATGSPREAAESDDVMGGGPRRAGSEDDGTGVGRQGDGWEADQQDRRGSNRRTVTGDAVLSAEEGEL